MRLRPVPADWKTIAGVDLAYSRKDGLGFCAAVVCARGDMAVLETAVATGPVDFPYIPGLLSFRELPLIIRAIEKLEAMPDIFLADGQGIAHPRRFGLACHIGWRFQTPSIGCAKSRLIGAHEEPGLKKGSMKPIFHKGEQIGFALRSRTNVKPLYISPGHLVDPIGAVEVVLECLDRVRIPTPTRLADRKVADFKREILATP